MPLTAIKNEGTYDQMYSNKFNKMLDGLRLNEQTYIREQFDNSELDAEKEACIRLCVVLQYYTLAADLKAQLDEQIAVLNDIENLLTNLKN